MMQALPLKPADYLYATYKPLNPQPRPQPRSFDPDDLSQRVMRVTGSSPNLWSWRWSRAGFAVDMSREEAEFWIRLAIDKDYWQTWEPEDLTGEITLDHVHEALRLRGGYYRLPGRLIVPLCTLLPLADLLPVIMETQFPGLAIDWHHDLHIYLSEDERAALQPIVRDTFERVLHGGQTVQMPLPFKHFIPPVLLWAAFLGLHDELESLVESWDDDLFTGRERKRKISHNYIHNVIYGLGSPEAVRHHTRRLQLYFQRDEHVRGWLAHTGDTDLEFVRDSVLKEAHGGYLENMVRMLGHFETVTVAGYMLTFMHERRGAKIAREWLDAHPELAVQAIVPQTRVSSNLAQTGMDYLRSLIRAGHEAIVMEHTPESVQERLLDLTVQMDVPCFNEETTPPWLTEQTTELEKSSAKPPFWLDYHGLPAVQVDDHRLNEQQVILLVRALKRSPTGKPHPLLILMRQYADPYLLDAWCWQLIQQWLTTGNARASDAWCIRAAGFLGTETLVTRFAPLAKSWIKRKRTFRRRMQFVIDTLRDHASDAAVLQLFAMRPDVHRIRLTAYLDHALEHIARLRGVSVEALADMAVPDCGLRDQGRIFDYGRRQFEFVLSPDLQPMVRDESGKLRKNLPRPGKLDDETKAMPARERWKALKKDLKAALKVQSRRLEQAMLYERRWSWHDFDRYFLTHPLMQHLVQQLVWGTYDDSGQLQQTFRVVDDLTFADHQDQDIEPNQKLSVGIVHPVAVTLAIRLAWNTIFYDYEIITLFPQMGRDLCTLDADYFDEIDLSGLSEAEISIMNIRKTMIDLGWEAHAGQFYYRYFPQVDITAIIRFRYLPAISGQSRFERMATVYRCRFLSGQVIYTTRLDRLDVVDYLKAGTIPDLILSEVLRDLTINLSH